MPLPFPHEYKVDLKQIDGPLATLKGEHEPELKAGPPVHFDGPGGIWSPETLLLGAVELCYLTTLSSLCRRQSLTFSGLTSTIRGILEKGPTGITFTRIMLDVNLKTRPENMETMKTLLQSAKKYCIISNALKTEVTLNANLSEER